MKTIVACASLLLLGGNMFAQNYFLAIQQAKRTSANNDAEQQRTAREANGGTSASPGSMPGAAPGQAADPALQATLKNVSSLQADFAQLISSASDKPDPSQKPALMTDLSSAAEGTKASSESVKKVAADLMTALNGKKKLTTAQQTRLAREVHALFNSSHLSTTQQQAVLTDVQKILTDGGASLDDAVNLSIDLKQVVVETK